MLRSLPLALFLTFALSLHLCHAQLRNPCHPNRNAGFMGAPCEVVRLPSKLCRKCRLGPYDAQGRFLDCTAIYDLDDEDCRAEIQNYINLNDCDVTRKNHFAEIDTNPLFKQALDYFVYSVCEECCDCIPIGVRPDEYTERRGTGTLISEFRGNCPVHAWFDICRIWPEIRYVTSETGDLTLDREKMCPIITTWFRSDDSMGWLRNPQVNINKKIARFLRQFARAARCKQMGVWQRCAALEFAQGRL